MKITQENLYHGAALNQIADHPQFTAINVLTIARKNSRAAFGVNDKIAVYLKYAEKAAGRFAEYQFTFQKRHLDELAKISESRPKVFIALVCIQDREICCLSQDSLCRLVDLRTQARGKRESQYAVLVTLKPNEAFRVSMNAPGKRKTYLDKPIKISRRDFPNALFD